MVIGSMQGAPVLVSYWRLEHAGGYDGAVG